MNIGSKTLKSTGWSSGGLVVNQVMTLARLAVLARLLSPEDFGLYAMAFVFFSLVQTMGNIGTSAALIQRENPGRLLTSSIFYVNLILGLVLTLIVYFTAPFVASVYQQDLVEPVLKWLALVFLMSSIGLVHATLLRKELKFEDVTKAEVFANIVSTIICIGLAYAGYGVYSFVFQMISFAFVNTILLWFYEKWKPEFVFSFSEIKTVVSFSLNLTAFNIINHVATNVDKFLIGKFLGSSSLGAYYIAYRVILMPMKQVTNVVKNVLFSTLSKLQNDQHKLQTILIKSIHIISIVAMPCMFLVMCLADTITLAILGDKWAKAEPIITIFAPVGLLQALSAPTILIFLVKDKTSQMVRLGVWNLIIVPSGVILGSQWGLMGIAIGYSLATIYMSIFVMVRGLALIDVTLFDVLRELKWVIGKSCYTASIAYVLNHILHTYTALNSLQCLVIAMFISVAFYCGISFKVVKLEYSFLKSFV